MRLKIHFGVILAGLAQLYKQKLNVYYVKNSSRGTDQSTSALQKHLKACHLGY